MNIAATATQALVDIIRALLAAGLGIAAVFGVLYLRECWIDFRRTWRRW